MIGTLDLPLGHLALDYPGIGSSAAKGIQPPKECGDRPSPDKCVCLRVVRGEKRPIGQMMDERYAALR